MSNDFVYSNSKILLLWLFFEPNPKGLLYLRAETGNTSRSTLDQMQVSSANCPNTQILVIPLKGTVPVHQECALNA